MLDFVKGKIFLNNHNPLGYYISAYSNFRLYSFLRRKQIENKYKPFRYHMLNIFRIQQGGKKMPQMNSNQFEKYCEKMEKVLWDDRKCLEAFKEATFVIDSVVENDYNREVAKRKGLVESINNSL
ncbi:AIPR protein (fragment) [Hyella patelloides LEGE 07179]|uniref:AIPR protein n=1 Tax=Hyella patelloides LEGE 07179 TaxID=945734 RepID=A0A563VQ99_9CYAN